MGETQKLRRSFTEIRFPSGRIAQTIITLFVVFTGMWLLFKTLPGDPTSMYVDGRLAPMALTHRNPPRRCIHHSDQGVKYAAHEHVDLLRERGFRISMSQRANPFDNAMVESFFETLESEEVSLWEYETLAEVQKRIPYFIEEAYNRRRLHSSPGYLSPHEFEQMLVENQSPIGSCQITLTSSV